MNTNTKEVRIFNRVYDEPDAFAKYKEILNKNDFHEHFEIPAMNQHLPPLKGLNVVNLGCGTGIFEERALKEGVNSIIALDLSKRMIDDAKINVNNDPRVTFLNIPMEDFQVSDELVGTIDLVVSSYAFHLITAQGYVALVDKVYKSLKPGGRFIYSTCHPIMVSGCESRWSKDSEGNVNGWIVQNYHQETQRKDCFLVDTYLEQHKTIQTLVNTLIKRGFRIDALDEPEPTKSVSEENLYHFAHRPYILIVASTKV
eukprot:gene11918-14576_t